MNLARRAPRALAAALLGGVALLALAAPAFAQAPAAASLSASVPLAVRASHAFTVRGTASTAVSPGETVTVSVERLSGAAWSVAATSAVTVGSHQQFSAVETAGKRGHWRVRVDLPASGSHTSATVHRDLKAVGAKVVALTFDDGPWPSSTAKILSALKNGDAQATFFTLGSQIKSRASLVAREIAQGNAVGVHSWNHALMTKRSASVNRADLARCKKVVWSVTGQEPHWFRPPYGATNRSLKRTAESLGFRQVIWSVDTLDWKYRTQSSVVSRALAGTRDGSIVLMHDGGGPRGATAAAVPVIIRKLRAKGFDFVTLDEMAALGYKVR